MTISEAAQELLALLEIEQLEDNLFRGIGTGGETSARIYGGQVIAQALQAAYHTVEGRMCHSLHAYFLRPGDPSRPVIYDVDRARDGGSFTTRRVVAIQHGRQIFNMSASFHNEESGWHHQHAMPDVLGPDGLENSASARKRQAERIPQERRTEFLRVRPIEIREVEPRDILEPAPMSDINHLWFRMADAAGQCPKTQQILLAYASDINLLASALRPHGVTWFGKNVMTASLDHAMWFHGAIDFKSWHLYALDAPFSGGARGMNRGKIYTQSGALVASVAQEGLMRPL